MKITHTKAAGHQTRVMHSLKINEAAFQPEEHEGACLTQY